MIVLVNKSIITMDKYIYAYYPITFKVALFIEFNG